MGVISASSMEQSKSTEVVGISKCAVESVDSARIQLGRSVARCHAHFLTIDKIDFIIRHIA